MLLLLLAHAEVKGIALLLLGHWLAAHVAHHSWIAEAALHLCVELLLLRCEATAHTHILSLIHLRMVHLLLLLLLHLHLHHVLLLWIRGQSSSKHWIWHKFWLCCLLLLVGRSAGYRVCLCAWREWIHRCLIERRRWISGLAH